MFFDLHLGVGVFSALQQFHVRISCSFSLTRACPWLAPRLPSCLPGSCDVTNLFFPLCLSKDFVHLCSEFLYLFFF